MRIIALLLCAPFVCTTGDLRDRHAAHTPIAALAVRIDSDCLKERLFVDTQRSIIHWKGTKFWGMRSHEGILRLKEGSLTVVDGQIVAGRFVIDMTTIEVTDIPKSDPVPRKRLRDHLIHEDFFFVKRFPTAVFDITAVRAESQDRHEMVGRLTMRGVTHEIRFTSKIPVLTATEMQATASLSIDRQHWGVAYRGSRLTNDLVDDEIHLQIVLIADRASGRS